jgi:NAD(P)-dependent dehydrogenase (short-subunit alcohol dehydrogenase family)
MEAATVIVGGTSGIGLELARSYAGRGHEVVITGRDGEHAAAVAAELEGSCRGLGLDLTDPAGIGERLASVGSVGRLALLAIERDENSVREYDLERATRLVTMKLVGYTEVIHALLPGMSEDSSIVLFGGLAKDRPYPGSTTVTTVNGGVTGIVRTLAVELAPIRVNGLHPGVVGDSPAWEGKPPAVLGALVARTPLGRLVTMEEVADAAVFLLENPGVNAVNLPLDGGWLVQ